jgi:stage III sporulation protein AH
MEMDKKQAGIIVTLLALIVCAGILAAKANGPLGVNTMETSGMFNFGNENKETKTTTDFFTTNNLQRDEEATQTLARYMAMIEDKNVSAETRKDAEQKYTAKTDNLDRENTIESNLKANGFDDALCLITDSKCTVIVKAKEVTDKQVKQINDIVISVAKIKDVDIQAKQ